MLGLLGGVEFTTNKKQVDEIREEVDFGITSSNRIGNHVKHQASSKGKSIFTITGKTQLQKIRELEDLRDLGNEQKPVTFSIESLPTIQVTINKLSTVKKNFLNTGEHLEQDFTLVLERYYK